MKIGEEDINHNAVRLIDELDVWDLTGDDMHDYQVMTLGYIKGVTEMAKVMYAVSDGTYNHGNFTLLVDANGNPLLYGE